ncbi:MAG: alginate lyase family protein [Candidatus Lokiarchaeia archaeon]
MKETIKSKKILKATEVVLADLTTYIFKKYNFLKIVLPNLWYQIIRSILYSKHYKKKKFFLKTSYKSDKILDKFFNKKINYQSICNDFFEKAIFSYSRLNEKKKIISLIKELPSIDYNIYIDYAEDIINNNYRIFEITHNFKEKIDWHYSFFDDYSFDIVASEKIDYFGYSYKNALIDVKYVWEFNRHQFLPYLGVAYYITGKEKYAKKYEDLIIDWIENNPPLFGVNWASSLEISIRLITWIFSLWFFRNSEIINNKIFFKKIFRSMFQHAYYLRFFYTRYSFNHTVGDLFGGYLFSKTFNNLKPLKKWEKKFFKKFRKQIFLHTRSDGVDIEHAINYHRFVLEFFTLFLIFNKKKLEEKELNRIEKMFDFLLFTIKPDKTFPTIGDSDDGFVLPLNLYNKNKFKDLINLGSILFNRSDLKFISTKLSFLSLLVLGYEGYLKFKNMPIKKPVKNYHFFDKTGYITFRDSWSKESNYLFLDFGKFGPLHAPHSHSDITNIVLYMNGMDILIDSGTFSYNKSWVMRNLFRSSKSHNVLTINSKNQAQIVTRWLWKDKPQIRRKFFKKDNHFHFSCYHNGYDNFIIYRKVIVQDNFKDLTIRDEVIPTKGSNENTVNFIDSYYHFDNKNKMELKGNKIFINSNLVMEFRANKELALSLINTYYSPEYGIKIPNKTLRIRIEDHSKNNENVKIITKVKSLNN